MHPRPLVGTIEATEVRAALHELGHQLQQMTVIAGGHRVRSGIEEARAIVVRAGQGRDRVDAKIDVAVV